MKNGIFTLEILPTGRFAKLENLVSCVERILVLGLKQTNKQTKTQTQNLLSCFQILLDSRFS